MKLTQSQEDYIEAIYILETNGEKIKSVEIANMLGVSKPAVTKAMKELMNEGLIEKRPYTEINFTDEGRLAAKEVYHRHVVIRAFLMNKLGVSREIAEKDCCMIEHVISPETIKAMEKFKK